MSLHRPWESKSPYDRKTSRSPLSLVELRYIAVTRAAFDLEER